MTSAALDNSLPRRFFVLLVDLNRQFARGQQNQHAGFLRRFALQHFDHRDQKRQRLAGSGLRRRQHVFALKGMWYGLRLDGRRGNELSCRQPLL